MQKLHLVGVTTDQEGLILSTRRGARTGSYSLAVDGELIDAVQAQVAQRDAEEAAGEEARQAAASARPDSRLGVREIQAQLRQGRSIEEVAEAAGVDPSWVERFAPPVIAEQEQVAARVRAMPLERARLGTSALPIGAAVSRNLAERGVVLSPGETDQAWSASQLADGRWSVRFTYRYRARDHVLRFDLDEGSASVEAADRSSSQLGYVAPPTKRREVSTSASAGGRAQPAQRAVGAPRGKPSSRAGKERARAASAMTKAAAKRSREAERAAARKARERQAAEKEAARRRAAEGRAAAAEAKASAAAAEQAKVHRAKAAKASRVTATATTKKAAATKRKAKATTNKAKATTKKAPTAKRRAPARRPAATHVTSQPTPAAVHVPRPATAPTSISGAAVDVYGSSSARALFRAGLVEQVADRARVRGGPAAPSATSGAPSSNGSGPGAPVGRPRRTRPLRAT